MGFNHGLKFQCTGDCFREIDVSVRVVYPIIMYVIVYLIMCGALINYLLS